MEVLAFRDAIAASDAPLHANIVKAIDVVANALHVFGARRHGIVFSFNGGKDSTVALHILRAALHLWSAAKQARSAATSPSHAPAAAGHADGKGAEDDADFLGGSVPVVYFQSPNNFPEVVDFMSSSEKAYGFRIRKLGGFKTGLQALIADGMQAVIMGTRASDPDGGALEHFTPTSLNWPPSMRVCPILHWPYAHVWAFLRGVGLPYCHLYDLGYTSLGSVADSVPNPLLRRARAAKSSSAGAGATADCRCAADGKAAGEACKGSCHAAAQAPTSEPGFGPEPESEFLPAYMLDAGDADENERLGRKKLVVSSSGGARGGAGAAATDGATAAATAASGAAARTRADSAGSSGSATTGSNRSSAASRSTGGEIIPTACVIVVGDELLAGHVADANGPFLCAALSQRGIRVDAIMTLPDDVEAIATAVRRASPLHTHVLVCGGVGPTHDDVTMKAVGQAFGYKLARSPAFAKLLHSIAADKAAAAAATAPAAGLATPSASACADEATLRMADLPFGPDVTLLYADGGAAPAFAAATTAAATTAASEGGSGSGAAASTGPAAASSDMLPADAEEATTLCKRGYPLVRVRNVAVFPGVPSIVRRKWTAHQSLFTGLPVAAVSLRVQGSEWRIAPLLQDAVAAHAAVKIGSYPVDAAAGQSGTGHMSAPAPAVVLRISAVGSLAAADVAAAVAHVEGALREAGLPFAPVE